MTARQGITVHPRIPDTQGLCCLTDCPIPTERFIGRAIARSNVNDMNGTGVLNVAGTYECEILTDFSTTIDVAVRCSAVTGTVIPYLRTRWNDGTTRDEAAGVALVANTAQVLTLSALKGQRKAYLVFTLAPGDSLTFNRAEFNTL